jgi:Family of unknown function (DUF6519)
VGSDRARISFDPTRGYRSVVAQQGRVTLEADVNEQASIESEALRIETIDLIGPAGTPDPHGYEVSVASGAITVAPGTMYVGGWRMVLEKTVSLAKQPEWLDQPATPATTAGNSVVALLVIEQFISATEDQALREVALGGPDSAARTKLIQHFVEIPIDASSCEAAEELLRQSLRNTMGLVLNLATLRLDFDATLQVDPFTTSQPTDPCCPPAQGGYLGADNQLVCVTVASLGSSPTLLWGWNNASFLYRATVVNSTAASPVLQLSPAPVDAAHSPQPGQVVEILQTTTVLGDPADGNYVAAQQGLLVTLGPGTVYDSTTKQLTLPSGTTLPTDPNTLFVRLWQAAVPFTPGQSQQLDSVSGLTVTVTIKALPTAPLQARPFWCFAVRPNTPQLVYPQRYLEAPQRPDGPRQWLCDLAIVNQKPPAPVSPPQANGALTLVADCRKHFPPLTDVTDCTCCELVLDPSTNWLGTLNAALNDTTKSQLSLCFMPGEFIVTSKVTFTGKTVKMTGAGDGTLIFSKNLEVVLEFDQCVGVNLSDFVVEALTAGYPTNNATSALKGLQGAITLRDCLLVDIERITVICANADLRAASCLAVYNTARASKSDLTNAVYNPSSLDVFKVVRVSNSTFLAGYNQVGILMVNADCTLIEGNLIYNKKAALNVGYNDLTSRPAIRARLAKNLLHSMTITNTAPPTTKKAKRRLLRKQRKAAGTTLATQAAKSITAHQGAGLAPQAGTSLEATTPAAAHSPPISTDIIPKAANTSGAAPGIQPQALPAPVKPKLPTINLGALNLSHITHTFGDLKLEFISSSKLTNAWTDALRAAGLNSTSMGGEIHTAVKAIVKAALTNVDTLSNAFKNYVNALLPQLYSTSSQGIVVAGNVANDIRILNNTIDGAVQGIHVGLGDMKASPLLTRLPSTQVQIRGNTVNILLTPETNGGRHGIFLSSIRSGIISDNHITLQRTADASQDIYGIKVVGVLGLRVLIERNAMFNFNGGIYVQPESGTSQSTSLWKASDNASTSANYIPSFILENNVP